MSQPADGGTPAAAAVAVVGEQGPRATLNALLPFSQLADSAMAAPRWRKWIGQLENYFIAVRETNGAVKRSTMLHMGGDELYELFLDLPGTGDRNDYDKAVRALDRYFHPQVNPDFEHFKLRQAKQRKEESVDMFFARLRKLASSCTGIDKQLEIRAQLIQG